MGTPGSDKIATFAKLADGILKLLAAVLVAYATYVVSRHESLVSGASILTQREQAEMDLRKSMLEDFHSEMLRHDADLEDRLLAVQLMALNFHDHFEFKPMLQSVHEKLKPANSSEDGDAEKLENGRSALYTLARRIISRQSSMLIAEGGDDEVGAALHSIYFSKYLPETDMEMMLGDDCAQWIESGNGLVDSKEDRELNSPIAPALVNVGATGERVCVQSPDGRVTLNIALLDFDRAEMQAKVAVRVVFHDPDKPDKPDKNDYFSISAFDFPLTDNWQVDSSHRFALTLYDARDWEWDGPLHLKLIWFPKDYITARERPLSYGEMMKLLKVNRDNGR